MPVESKKKLVLCETDKEEDDVSSSHQMGSIVLNKAFGVVTVYLKDPPFDIKAGESVVLHGVRAKNRVNTDTHSGYKGLYKLPILRVRKEKING